jgi:transcriptional regulator with GAF, ATPase, and Fis domain
MCVLQDEPGMVGGTGATWERGARLNGWNPPPLTTEQLATLREQFWPGNVRQLQNTLELKQYDWARGRPWTLESADRRMTAPRKSRWKLW